MPSRNAERSRARLLFNNFFHRELTTRYLGSMTGLAWALLHPLALLGVYGFVFTTVFRTTGFAGQSFLAFVAVALWPWLAAQEGLQRATVSLAGYAGLIRKVAFPHEIVVYASVAATLTLQFAGYVAVLIVLRIAGESIHFEGMLLAIAVLIILMYLTPILYPLTLVPESLRPWVAANPFSWLVGRLRDALLDGRLSVEWSDAVAFVVALLLLVAGRAVFRRLSPHFEDFV